MMGSLYNFSFHIALSLVTLLTWKRQVLFYLISLTLEPRRSRLTFLYDPPGAAAPPAGRLLQQRADQRGQSTVSSAPPRSRGQ
jgi:hypothetical protein